jgi:hypothetical protein
MRTKPTLAQLQETLRSDERVPIRRLRPEIVLDHDTGRGEVRAISKK